MSAVRVVQRSGALLLALLVLAPAGGSSLGAQAPVTPAPNPLAVPSRTPPVRVTLSAEDVVPGDRVRVLVRPRSDGYLVVLHADPAGRVRVLFPLDPDDTQRVPGATQRALPSRDGSASFVVGSTTGDGAVLAAISATPFRVAPLASAGHWNVRAFPPLAPDADLEGELVAVVGRMRNGGARFDYAVAPYRVTERMPIVVYGSDAYGDADDERAASQGASTRSYFDDDLYAYGFPFDYGGFFFGAPCLIGRGRGGSFLGPECFASGHVLRRDRHRIRGFGHRGFGHRGFGQRGFDRRGRQPGDLAFPGNPFFGEPRPFGRRADGPRAIAGPRRPGVLPPAGDAGGIIFRSRPTRPFAASGAPWSAGGMIGTPARPFGGAAPRQPSAGAPRSPSPPRRP